MPLSRRQFLINTSLLSCASFFSPSILQAQQTQQSKLLGFKAITTSTQDTVRVPEGYQAKVLISWGDPLFPHAPAFDPSGKATADQQKQQFGDNNDGLSFFSLSKETAVIAVNHESTNARYLYHHQGTAITADDVKKAQAAIGMSIFAIKHTDKGWVVNQHSPVNRRITAKTPFQLSGPAAGHTLVKTAIDPSGTQVLGTLNNCANGKTPWGTFLSCEENFNAYFAASRSDYRLPNDFKRYGISPQDWGWKWSYHDKQFDLSENPNEPNRHGWVVEIDPLNPNSTPKKRTALGRFKHENAAIVLQKDGRVLVYMGDDQQDEFLYKFVSKQTFDPKHPEKHPDILDEGTLYAAQFHGTMGKYQGKGRWIALTFGKNGLTPDHGFHDQAEILIKARLAASQVGATPMDRPEWVAVHPNQQHVYCTLTNNLFRGMPTGHPLSPANPIKQNAYGHIIRWHPSANDHTQSAFSWDIFLIAGNPSVFKQGMHRGSSRINEDNMFNCPDGIAFDKAGRLWIQTDGNYSNQGYVKGMGNNQLLCADPATGEIKRFMTAPTASEITGMAFSPDQTTFFVCIQHPGEKGHISHFPDGGLSKPRSSIVMITRKDGGIIGDA